MRRVWTGRLHEIAIAIGPSGRTLRYCKNCGATWELHNLVTHTAWRAIREEYTTGREMEVEVDIRECGATSAEPTVTAPVAVAAPVAAKNLCYCPTCRVKKQHFDGNDSCFCVKCQGKHPHKSAA